MSLSLLSALEIFTNPGDLQITIGRTDADNARYAIGIFRGPGHNYKPIITSVPFAEKIEDAVLYIKNILEFIHKRASEEFKNPTSITSQYLNPDKKEMDQSKVLNPELIERILDELRKHQVADTAEMFAPVGAPVD